MKFKLFQFQTEIMNEICKNAMNIDVGWNEIMHKYADTLTHIFSSKLWTLQNYYLFNSISQQSSECLFDVTDLCIFAWNSTIWENIRPLFYYARWFTGWFYSSWSSVSTMVRIYNICPKIMRHFCLLNK